MSKTRTPLIPTKGRLITDVPLRVLPVRLQEKAMAAYEAAMRHPDYRMTYREAAHLYGVSYSSLRYYVHMKDLKVLGKGLATRITHQAIRNFISRPPRTGRTGRPSDTIKIIRKTH